jgi:hypothetical protein
MEKKREKEIQTATLELIHWIFLIGKVYLGEKQIIMLMSILIVRLATENIMLIMLI